MKVSLIGAGRLGRSLAALLKQAGLHVEVLGRREQVSKEADVIVLTVPDRAIEDVASNLEATCPILHCSGAMDWRALRPLRPIGWFHPLMTFPGPQHALPSLQGVPIAIDGDDEARACAESLAACLGAHPLHVPGDPRLYHCAAVIAGNFSTLLLHEAARCMESAGIPRRDAARFLYPLMQASIQNTTRDPKSALTGPAVRGDHDTIQAHREALKEAGLHEITDLYDQLTQHSQRLVSD